MISRHRFARFALTLLLLGTALLRAAAPFPQEGSDLAPDPAVHFGRLPNGVRYAIMANHEPKGRTSLRLLIEAGSFDESEPQRGLAHFLEHMAFNGSRDFPADSLVETLQRLGMNFGADTNAHTAYDHTLYQLELPDSKSETLALGLTIFENYAAHLTLTPEEIDRERGIILSEKRDRDSVDSRLSDALWAHLYPGTLLATRKPIGLEEVIQHAGRDRLLDFYDTWYRPERMTVVAVGDFDPAAMEALIVSKFSSLTARAPAREAPPIGTLSIPVEPAAWHYHEPELTTTNVMLLAIAPGGHEDDTAANRLKYLPRNLAFAMLNRRLQQLARKEDAPFLGAAASAGEEFDFVREVSVSATCRPEQWPAALDAIDLERRRAIEQGFRPDELQEAVTNFVHGLEEGAKNAATLHSGALADALAGSLNDKLVFTTPAADLALFKPALERITPQACTDALREAWSIGVRHVVVNGNAKIEGDAPAAILAAYRHAAALPLGEAAVEEKASWAYGDFGPAGRIVKRDRVADLDVTLVTFANGVRLNLKKTDFDANQIGFVIRVGSGQLSEPEGRAGLAAFTNLTFAAGGLGRHSVEDLTRLLAGRSVSASFGVGGDAFAFNGGSNRADLLLTLQLVTAMITDPGYRPEALWLARRGIEQSYQEQEHSLGAPFAREVAGLLASGDSRFVQPPKSVMLGYTLDDVKAWLAPELAHGPVEITVVGDLNLEATIGAVAKTLGTLPTRSAPADLAARRKLLFPVQPFDREFRVPTTIPQGVVAIYWPTTDALDVSRNRRLSLLGAVLSDRLRVKIREELGDAYSPSAGSMASDLFPGYGYMAANATVAPATAHQVMTAIVAVGDDLSRHGITTDELERVKKPTLAALRDSLRNNGYWLSALARAQEKPESLDWPRTRQADVASITTDDLSALARTYLGAARASSAIVLPAAEAPTASSTP